MFSKKGGVLVLVALALAIGTAGFSGILARLFVSPEQISPADKAYPIEVTAQQEEAPALPSSPSEEASSKQSERETLPSTVSAAKGIAPILGMIESADLARGEKMFNNCKACHSIDKRGKSLVGPNLYGVVGGPKNHMAGFSYSNTLQNQGGTVWTYAELNKFLYKPKAYAPETKMTYLGLKKHEDRAALIAWLRSKADTPTALPTQAEIEAEKKDLGQAGP